MGEVCGVSLAPSLSPVLPPPYLFVSASHLKTNGFARRIQPYRLSVFVSLYLLTYLCLSTLFLSLGDCRHATRICESCLHPLPARFQFAISLLAESLSEIV